ncbi:exopolyphosphatase/guanosine-5'-triphosphate,3'-diphosphate pyrophosphatase [Thermosulfidibacter takaii ABI70S6]|uniref:Exopolyphosphatase/guanosine-5'-triphosphate,3'-diphosphate pyrophosphatase n=1 Tax=Thermosulfidibacter takaii (strain DSM 17441 / JCM 13301 / NBRC 103674 / ABI70S6) TaxID=1298851 RepID=A0A0S3QRN0_THET7|nr:exopolyphosphatase/guanosine-5'-triphosphate,3'-diphosphate pyrophosphatase [Thermosulfidibacter takaii ABI70S6]
MKIASVDIGTNTARLLVAEADESRSIRWIYADRAVVRLGEGLRETGRLKVEAIERTISVLRRFKRSCDDLGVDLVIPVATAAVREAKNGHEFVDRVKKEVGWDVKVISGEEEAYYTYLGVKKGLGLDKDFLVFDIGGGSTEYICAGDVLKARSLRMGVVKLTEEFLHHDPPLKEEVEALRKKVGKFLEQLGMEKCEKKTVVGTAGTPTTLAAIDMKLEKYDPEKVHGYRLSLGRLTEIEKWLLSIPASERLKIPGMEKGREDLIVAGIVIVVETLKKFKADEMVVSEWGIREGIIVDAINKGKNKVL